MGISISTTPPLAAEQQARQAGERLTQGLARVSSAKSHAAGGNNLAPRPIADAYNPQVRQRQVEMNSLQGGISVSQVADSGLAAQQEALHRLEDLALDAASGKVDGLQRAALHEEAQELATAVDVVAQETRFNGTSLLAREHSLDLGAPHGIQVQLHKSTSASLGVNAIDLRTPEAAGEAVEAIVSASKQLSSARGEIGSQMRRIESALAERDNEATELAAAAALRDADAARQALDQSLAAVQQHSGLAAMVQGNISSQGAVRLLRF